MSAVLAVFIACGTDDETTATRTLDGAVEDAGADNSGGAAGLGGAGGATVDGSAGIDGSFGGSAGLGAGGQGGNDTDGSMEDTSVDAPVSTTCGDGIRDPITEECDDGTGTTPADSCDLECRVEDVLLHPLPLPDSGNPYLTRRLGLGRHPVAGGDSGFAVATVRTVPAPTTISVRAFDTKGVPGAVMELSGNTIQSNTHPTLAAVPGGKYALVYADNGGDGAGRGVALRILDPATQGIGPLVRVNSTTLGGQYDADVVWTGSELAIAWVDDSKLTTQFLNTTIRTFSATGTATSSEIALGTGPTSESDVSVAESNGSWAAAWRTSTGAGIPPVFNVRMGSTSWTTSPTSAGPADERPAVVGLDAGHVAVFFVDGTGGPVTPRLRAALLDTATPGDTLSFPIEPLVEPYASDPSLYQMHVAAVRSGDEIFVAWRSEPVIGSTDIDDVWLKKIPWDSSGGTLTLDLSSEEIPLPRAQAHWDNGQQRPSLAVMKLPFESLLATAWDDYGRVFGPIEGQPDVVAELIPLPIVRLPNADGGLGK
jgi:cysteine-rich repeat protein